MTDITELAQLRFELSNPAIGSKDHLRKLALSLVEALEKAQKDGNEYAASERTVVVKNVALQDEIYGLKARITELEDAEQKLCAANVTLDARADLAKRQLESRTVKLPPTRLWAGVTECYEKSDVIAAILAAGVEVSDD